MATVQREINGFLSSLKTHENHTEMMGIPSDDEDAGQARNWLSTGVAKFNFERAMSCGQ